MIMKEQEKGGCIVNISSLSGIRFMQKFPDMSAYIVSKHGIVGLTEALAIEGKPFNIHVNCVAPGAVDTKMLKQAFPEFQGAVSPEKIANIIAKFCYKDELGSFSGTTYEVIT